MPVITPTFPRPRPSGVVYVEWKLAAGDTGRPVNLPQYSDKNLTISSANFATTAATFEGTDDPRGNPDHADHANAPWVPATDTLDAGAISKTANATEVILQNFAWIRPKATGGTATEIKFNLTCTEA